MIPLMSTSGGGDQVKKRTVGLWATPLTDWGGDDGAASKRHHCSTYISFAIIHGIYLIEES